jgi:hypothetical protein
VIRFRQIESNPLSTASATGVALAYRYDGLGPMDRRQLNSGGIPL